jgi:hypothetical protein
MPWPHLDGIVKVAVTYGFDGKPSVNIHFILLDPAGVGVSQATLEIIGDIFFDALSAEWIPFMGDAWTIDEIVATDWTQESGGQFEHVTGLPLTGTEVAEETPASVTLVASHRTAKTGRSFRGRTYLPGLTEQNVGGNTVDSALQTAVGDYFDALATALAVTDTELVVYSLYSEGTARTTPVATPITSQIVNLRVDTQRRRLP